MKNEEVYDKIFVGNIKGYDLNYVMAFVEKLTDVDEKTLAKEVVSFANASNK